MGTIRGERTVEIDAPIERVFAIAADIERAPEWQPSLQDVEVLERDGERRATSVETESDAKVRTIRSRLRFAYEPPTRDHLGAGARRRQGAARLVAPGGPRRRAHARDLRPRGRPRPHARACCCAAPPRARCATSCVGGRPKGSRSARRRAERRPSPRRRGRRWPRATAPSARTGEPGDALPWATVAGWLADARNYWLCTARADGPRTSSPCGRCGWTRALVFSTSPESVSARHLRADPRATVHLEGEHVAVVEGEVQPARGRACRLRRGLRGQVRLAHGPGRSRARRCSRCVRARC